MKIGDSKQAMGLALVAVVAIGFLAKTAMGSFGGQTKGRPIEVKELQGGTDVNSAPATTQRSSEDKPELGSEENVTKPSMSLKVRDAFAKFNTQQAKDSERGVPGPYEAGKETMTQTQIPGRPYSPADPFEQHIDGNTGTLPNAEGTGKTEQKTVVPETVKKDPVTMRFDGYVNAGNPMAILTFKGISYTVSVGEILPDGLKVVTISSEKITVSKGKSIKTILVGREIEF